MSNIKNSEKFQMKFNTGFLFKKERVNERQPTFTGTINIEGKEYYISCWENKKNIDGEEKEYLSASITDKEKFLNEKRKKAEHINTENTVIEQYSYEDTISEQNKNNINLNEAFNVSKLKTNIEEVIHNLNTIPSIDYSITNIKNIFYTLNTILLYNDIKDIFENNLQDNDLYYQKLIKLFISLENNQINKSIENLNHQIKNINVNNDKTIFDVNDTLNSIQTLDKDVNDKIENLDMLEIESDDIQFKNNNDNNQDKNENTNSKFDEEENEDNLFIDIENEENNKNRNVNSINNLDEKIDKFIENDEIYTDSKNTENSSEKLDDVNEDYHIDFEEDEESVQDFLEQILRNQK